MACFPSFHPSMHFCYFIFYSSLNYLYYIDVENWRHTTTSRILYILSQLVCRAVNLLTAFHIILSEPMASWNCRKVFPKEQIFIHKWIFNSITRNFFFLAFEFISLHLNIFSLHLNSLHFELSPFWWSKWFGFEHLLVHVQKTHFEYLHRGNIGTRK